MIFDRASQYWWIGDANKVATNGIELVSQITCELLASMQVYFYFSADKHHTATPPGLHMLRSLFLILKIILIFISHLPVFSLGVIIPKQFHVLSGWKTAKDF